MNRKATLLVVEQPFLLWVRSEKTFNIGQKMVYFIVYRVNPLDFAAWQQLKEGELHEVEDSI